MAGADYWKYANETILTMAMIETQQALDNLDAILKTHGLDSIYVGPSDLGLSLGFQPVADPTKPKVMEAIKFIVDPAKKHKIPAGIHCGQPAWAREMIALGYQLVTLQNDNSLLRRLRATPSRRRGRRVSARSEAGRAVLILDRELRSCESPRSPRGLFACGVSPRASRHPRPGSCRGSSPTRARRGTPPRRPCRRDRPSGRPECATSSFALRSGSSCSACVASVRT